MPVKMEIFVGSPSYQRQKYDQWASYNPNITIVNVIFSVPSEGRDSSMAVLYTELEK